MPTIKVSEPVFRELQELAEPLVDTPDTVVRRLIEAFREGRQEATGTAKQPSRRRNASSASGSGRKRARKGEKTTHQELYQPLLQVLKAAGGQLSASDAIEGVGSVMAERLNDVDRAGLPSGEIRWRNTVRWASHRLQKSGELDPEAPYGFWRLSDSTHGEESS